MSKRVPRRPKDLDCRLIPAHLKRIRQMRRLVESSMRTTGSVAEDSPSPEAVTLAKAYLAKHASCEAILLGKGVGNDAGAHALAAASDTQVCSVCRTCKPLASFDKGAGVCIECKNESQDATADRKDKRARGGDGSKAKKKSSKTGVCPVCLQRVTVSVAGGARTIAGHKKWTKAGLVGCQGAGRVISREKRDALDHRVSGSFEGGRRR